jgi:thymidylate kinase
MFYNSSTVGGRSNGQHLILLTGAEQSGKTSLVRESLAHFRNRKLEMPGKKQGGPIPFNILTSPEDMEDQEK